MNNIDSNVVLGTRSDNERDKDPEVRKQTAVNASNSIRKFSDEVMKQIYKRRAEGATYKELMQEFNISSTGTLSYMINTKYQTTKE